MQGKGKAENINEVERRVLKYIHVLIPKTCEFVPLYGKKGFAEMIKIMDFELQRLSCIIHVGPSNHLNI